MCINCLKLYGNLYNKSSLISFLHIEEQHYMNKSFLIINILIVIRKKSYSNVRYYDDLINPDTRRIREDVTAELERFKICNQLIIWLNQMN